MAVRTCPVCARADRDAIDAAIRRGGRGLRVLATQTGVSKSVLGRHKAGCLGLAGVIERAEDEGERETVEPGQASVPDGVPEPVPGAPPVPGTSHGEARARPLSATANTAESFDERVLHIANLIARGRFLGRPTVKRLAAAWGVERGTVNDYARAAAIICRTDRGSIDQQREAAAGAWARIRERALVAEDWKAAAAAQAGLDRASGVVAPGGAQVQVNVLQVPGVEAFLQRLVGSLERFDERMAEAVERLCPGVSPEMLPRAKDFVVADLRGGEPTQGAPLLVQAQAC